MSVKSKKTVKAIENSQVAFPHSKITSGGRVYNSEQYAGPLSMRKYTIAHLKQNEKVSASDIFNIELMLQGLKRSYKIKPAERENIIAKYDLQYDESNHRWMGDPEVIFNKICEEYPQAIKYKKYTGLLYAMKYGDTECLTYKEEK